MVKTIQAIFENGVLRPIEPLDGLEDNRLVKVTVETEDRAPPLEGWSGGLDDQDAATMRRVIEEEFEQVNPDEWK
jgi:predicted DNA-binding antitoxin AbrB/MazE fold protein